MGKSKRALIFRNLPTCELVNSPKNNQIKCTRNYSKSYTTAVRSLQFEKPNKWGLNGFNRAVTTRVFFINITDKLG